MLFHRLFDGRIKSPGHEEAGVGPTLRLLDRLNVHSIDGYDVREIPMERECRTLVSEPRRGKMDNQDRFWFAEYTADNIAVLDGKTLKIQEWPTGIKWSGPYTASIPDAKGRVYAPAGAADRVFRLDPKTNEVIGYLMPTQDFDVKQATIAPDKKTLWMANERNARLVKVEPLD